MTPSAPTPSAPSTYQLLISAEQLQQLLASQRPCMVFDCSFDLANPQAGKAQYAQGHIPGAVYADLDQHLSARPHDADAASGGRHPLPSRQRFAQWLTSIGFDNTMQAVVYDRQGVNYCGRLWWMLQWAGHEAVAVLDGGLPAWQAQGGALQASPPPEPEPNNASRANSASNDNNGGGGSGSGFHLQPALRRLWTVQDIAHTLGQADAPCLLDARAPQRYRGELEPLDPVAGHIPGALNRPFSQNLALDGRFKPAHLLRAEFADLLAQHPQRPVVHYCGSGVSAIPNLLAMAIAGFADAGLMAGSWSQWCSDPQRPVAVGAEGTEDAAL